ncbi:MAG: AAA family ATPase [Chloroflexi bacterium]|nr:AAA family ATPase [Chloroflexota bacterium]
MDKLYITLMGQFQMRWQETAVIPLAPPRHQVLLAYLVLHANQVHTRQHLAFTFWPDSNEDQARTNLRKALHHLRHVLPQANQFLLADWHVVRWCEDAPYSLDVAEFATAVAHVHQSTTPADRRHYLETAIHLYQGDLLPGHYDDWVLAHREVLRQQYLECLMQQIQLLEAAREYAAAANFARLLLQADPLHETAYRRLMRLQALGGDRVGALRTYNACAAALQQELSVLPSASTQKAYQLLLTPVASADGQAARLPLVGRTRAWSALQASWRRVMGERPLFTLIRGEAGVGKTRLAEEMLDWTARQGIPALHAAGHALTHNLPYAPIADWLRGAALRQPLRSLADVWLREISRLLPELLVERPDLTPPGPISETWQRERFFTALAQVVLQLPQPFLLFMDDLQWCDVDTLEWFCFLLYFAPEARFLLLGAIREEEVSPHHPLSPLCHDLQHGSSFVQIELGRLEEMAVAELAMHVTGRPLDAVQTAQLYAETEGVPLFVVEMAGSWANNGEWECERLPDKVQALLEERLADLSPMAREVVDLAATIGRSFRFDLLAAASDAPETMLVEALDELCQRRILLEQGADAYIFSHDKLRQAAYASLSCARRRLLRDRVSAALAR